MLVLIVDDEPVVAETLGLIFKQSGFRIQVVHTADEAMQFALESRPDLILCDIEMPLRDGLSLMREIGRELPDCPILVLTGSYRSLGEVRDCAETLRQAVSVLTKPAQPVDVLRTAGRLLQTA